MVYSTATGSLHNDVHPGDTSLNMTPWTTATLILACPLALRYADDVARFTCWNQLALPIFCLNNPFPTHVLFWTFPNKNTLCVLGRRSRCQHAKTVRSEVYTYEACAHRALLGVILLPLQWRNCESEKLGCVGKKIEAIVLLYTTGLVSFAPVLSYL